MIGVRVETACGCYSGDADYDIMPWLRSRSSAQLESLADRNWGFTAEEALEIVLCLRDNTEDVTQREKLREVLRHCDDKQTRCLVLPPLDRGPLNRFLAKYHPGLFRKRVLRGRTDSRLISGTELASGVGPPNAGTGSPDAGIQVVSTTPPVPPLFMTPAGYSPPRWVPGVGWVSGNLELVPAEEGRDDEEGYDSYNDYDSYDEEDDEETAEEEEGPTGPDLSTDPENITEDEEEWP